MLKGRGMFPCRCPGMSRSVSSEKPPPLRARPPRPPPVELFGAACLPAPRPAELPATVLAEARSPSRTATHMVPSMPGAGVASEGKRIGVDVASLAEKRDMQAEADQSRADLRGADPTTVGSHLTGTGLGGGVDRCSVWL
mmetsp:Transcript_168595/g.409790  ORF Transcript_168595/g.409790 Transcript_168595/m.409790 type:complete len:140 (+) Transcript_168595:414-833(+)